MRDGMSKMVSREGRFRKLEIEREMGRAHHFTGKHGRRARCCYWHERDKRVRHGSKTGEETR